MWPFLCFAPASQRVRALLVPCIAIATIWRCTAVMLIARENSETWGIVTVIHHQERFEFQQQQRRRNNNKESAFLWRQKVCKHLTQYSRNRHFRWVKASA